MIALTLLLAVPLAGCLGSAPAEPEEGPTGPTLIDHAGCDLTYPDNSSVDCEVDNIQVAQANTPQNLWCLEEIGDPDGDLIRVWYDYRGQVSFEYKLAPTPGADGVSGAGKAVLDHGGEETPVVFGGPRHGFIRFRRLVTHQEPFSIRVDAAAFGAEGHVNSTSLVLPGTNETFTEGNLTKPLDVQKTLFEDSVWYAFVFRDVDDQLYSFDTMEETAGNGSTWQPTSRTFSGTDFRIAIHAHTFHGSASFDSALQAYSSSECREDPGPGL